MATGRFWLPQPTIPFDSSTTFDHALLHGERRYNAFHKKTRVVGMSQWDLEKSFPVLAAQNNGPSPFHTGKVRESKEMMHPGQHC